MRPPVGDRGSTIPLILGMFLIALLLVAGSVSAADAFVQQSQLQQLCDGAATAAAATSVTAQGGRQSVEDEVGYLVLDDVQRAVDAYRARDPARLGVTMRAALSGDRRRVAVDCEQTESIAFGAMFGLGGGVHHRVTATAAAALHQRT